MKKSRNRHNSAGRRHGPTVPERPRTETPQAASWREDEDYFANLDDSSARPPKSVQIVPAPTIPTVPAAPSTELIGAIHESVLTCLRVTKALVASGRAAGQQLLAAKAVTGDEGFRDWVDGRLTISADDAAALIQVAEQPEIAAAKVSPVDAMPLAEAVRLAGLLIDCFRWDDDGPAHGRA